MYMYVSIIAAEICTVVKFINFTQSEISENFRKKANRVLIQT